jgi:hypothetical protein
MIFIQILDLRFSRQRSVRTSTTAIMSEIIPDFPQSLQQNAGRQLLFKPFQNHLSSIIHAFNDM